MIHELPPQSLTLPRGLVTVDLINERGKVVQREQAENFISLQSQQVAKWWQRMMWGAFNPLETNDAFGNKPTEMPWFPAQHIAAWTDASAEAPSSEVGIRGDIIAWASRHPIGSPTGKRGVVDITGSEFKDAYAKWVFNWTTTQGNGTFQSVGWTRIDEISGAPMAGDIPSNTVIFGTAGNTGLTMQATPLYWDATASLWNTVEYVSATNQVRVVSSPATGGAMTQVCLLPVNAWTSSYPFIAGITRLGTDIIVCGGANGGSGSWLRRYNSSGIQTWQRGGDLPSTPYVDCTIDGSGNIWTAGGDGKMRRHNPADGTITSTITLTGIVPPALYGIAYDPADGGFWVRGPYTSQPSVVWKVTAAGAATSTTPLVSYYSTSISQTSSSPYAGTYIVPASSMREPYTLTLWRANSSTGSDVARQPATTLNVQGLTMKDTGLWGALARTGTAGAGSALPLITSDGYNGPGSLGSRSRLSAPVVKDSTKSMKITYQFDFS